MSTSTIDAPATAKSAAPPATPMVRHLVPRHRKPDGTWGEWQDTALCGALWDRLFVNGKGPLCDGCREELKRRLGGAA